MNVRSGGVLRDDYSAAYDKISVTENLISIPKKSPGGLTAQINRYAMRRISMKKRLLSVLCAASAVCMTAQPVHAANFVDSGETEDGYYYTEYNLAFKGNEDLTLYDKGGFRYYWAGISNCRAEVGELFQSGDSIRSLGEDPYYRYAVSIHVNKYCDFRFGIHIRFADRDTELFIVEEWYSQKPLGDQTKIGSGEADGKIYDYYEVPCYNHPSVEGIRNYPEIWAVAQTSSLRPESLSHRYGKVSFRQHLSHLARLNIAHGALYDAELKYIALYAEGTGEENSESRCEFTAHTNTLVYRKSYVEPISPQTTAVQPAVLCPGDANCDGTVDISDAVLVMRYAVADREAVISEQGIKNADCDGNGNTDNEDATLILQHIAKKINLNGDGLVVFIPDYFTDAHDNNQ